MSQTSSSSVSNTKSSPIIMISIMVVILAVFIGGGLYYYYYMRKTNSPSTTIQPTSLINPSSSPSTSPSTTPAIVIPVIPTVTIKCADEGGICSFVGTQNVYMKSTDGTGTIKTKSVKDNILCTKNNFNDTSTGVKACYRDIVAQPTSVLCADNNGTCSFTGTKNISYKAQDGSGIVITKPFTTTASCNQATFGSDPSPGHIKSCYMEDEPSIPIKCANEGDFCTFYGTKSVSYKELNGNKKTSFYKTNGVLCNKENFGNIDPSSGIAKGCFINMTKAEVEAYNANDTRVLCSNQGGNCTFDGFKNVTYKVVGSTDDTLSKTMTFNNMVTCNDNIFGDISQYNSKQCYLNLNAEDIIANNVAIAGYPVKCASEGGTCTFTGEKIISYKPSQEKTNKKHWGTNYAKNFSASSSGFVCNVNSFDGVDDYPNIDKDCYVNVTTPPILCGTEGQTCSDLVGEKIISYRAVDGSGYSIDKKFTGSALCTQATFDNKDPSPNHPKGCYIYDV